MSSVRQKNPAIMRFLLKLYKSLARIEPNSAELRMIFAIFVQKALQNAGFDSHNIGMET